MKSTVLLLVFGVMLGEARIPESGAVVSPSPRTELPPPARAQADPADSLYRAGRRALASRDYETAARLFDAIVARYPRSRYAPDAYYWKGFALYRDHRLEDAVDALEAQAASYPSATTRRDGASLLIRLKGELAKRGDPEARKEVSRAAQASTQECGDMEMRVAALDALQQMNSELALPLLRRVLERRDECSVPLRRNALFILAQRGGADRERILLDVVRNDPNREVRNEAVFHLSQAKSDAAIEALETVLTTSDDRNVRKNALFALAQQRSERARTILRTFALSNDTPEALRKDAIFHLAQRNDSASAAWLRQAYSATTVRSLKKDIMFHIAQRNDPEAGRWLVGVVTDPREPQDLRKDALFHAMQGRKAAAGDLAAVYDRVPADMKRDVIFHLGQRKDAAVLEKLIAIAKRDPDMNLRKEALFHLAQSRDPRAIKALEEIVTP